jgi:hypothetical protein
MSDLLNCLEANEYQLYFLSRANKSRYNFDFLAVRPATDPMMEPT